MLPINVFRERNTAKKLAKESARSEFDLQYGVETDGDVGGGRSTLRGRTYLSDLDIPSANWIYGQDYSPIIPDVSRKEIRPPDFMKIDIEGAEYDCLQGCRNTIRSFHPVIFLATHGRDMHDQCVKLLTEWNYDVVSLDDRPVESSDELVARPRN